MATHFRSHHQGSVSESQLPIVLDICDRPMDDTEQSLCLLCDKKMQLLDLQEHLALHMEDIALFVLPLRVDGVRNDASIDSLGVNPEHRAEHSMNKTNSVGSAQFFPPKRDTAPTTSLLDLHYLKNMIVPDARTKFLLWEGHDLTQDLVSVRTPHSAQDSQEYESSVDDKSSQCDDRSLGDMAALASTYRNEKRWTEAEELETQIVQTCTNSLGADHPLTLSTMNNLAITLADQGKLAHAVEIHSKVLDKRKKVLGQDHLDTIKTMSNLAITLAGRGEHAEILKMQREVLEKRKKTLGDEHLDTISAMNNLAFTLGAQGELAEAEQIQRKVLEKRTQILGEEHPDTVRALENFTYTVKMLTKKTEVVGTQGWKRKYGMFYGSGDRYSAATGHRYPASRNYGFPADAQFGY